jgi:hypothetical protein
MTICVSKTYASTYSFLNFIDSINSLDLVEEFIAKLKSIIDEFNKYNYIRILFSNDLVDLSVNGVKSLNDKIEELSDGEEQAYFYYLGEIENILGSCQSYLDTSMCEEEIKNQIYLNFPYCHPFTLDDSWLSLPGLEHVSSTSTVLNLNSKHIQKKILNPTDFIDKAKAVYGDLIFYPDISLGDYTRYISCFCHALNTLNQSYNTISCDAERNLDDLILISTISSKLGPRTLVCTRQGSNKVERIFGSEMINCEYHLKLNFNDLGKKLSKDKYNRIYFGLKYNKNKGRKEIYLAHIGKHL